MPLAIAVTECSLNARVYETFGSAIDMPLAIAVTD